MWKYVSRRVKDTLERTANVLDVGRTSFCSSSGLGGESQERPPGGSCNGAGGDGRVLLYKKRGGCLSWFKEKNGRFSGKEEGNPGQERSEKEKERLDHQEGFAQTWLSAVTWSSAIVCGWYTSQYMCLRRKRMGWMPVGQQQQQHGKSCMYANILMNTTRSLHSNVTSRIALAAPPPSASSSLSASGIQGLLQNINNPIEGELESKESIHSIRSKRSSSSRSSSSLESAVAEFSFTIGEIEYQFAVQDLRADNYKSAVNHLKLATTHHHPAGTFNLGLCYERGLGVEKDLKMAMQCYSLASAMGHPKAMYNLGVYYVRGWAGLRKSRKAARECFDAAARLGQKEAQVAMEMHQERQMKRNIELLSNTTGFGVQAF